MRCCSMNIRKLKAVIAHLPLASGQCRHLSESSANFTKKFSISEQLFQNDGAHVEEWPQRVHPEPWAKKWLSYADFISARRTEARQSLFVQVESEQSSDALIDYCSAYVGRIKALYFHTNPKDQVFKNFFIVEFDNDVNVSEVMLNQCRLRNHSSKDGIIPVHSPFVWFSRQRRSSSSDSTQNRSRHHVPVFVPDNQPFNLSLLEEQVKAADNLDDQMTILHKMVTLQPRDIRLRFMACRQLELVLNGLFPKAHVNPFGSSVSAFGRLNSDLDMVVSLGDPSVKMDKDSCLVLHCKQFRLDDMRHQQRVYIEHIAGILRDFLPGCHNVETIPHARVPIVSYWQSFLGLDCDVSLAMSGCSMSELIYIFGQLDWRVPPLVSTIRMWAREQGLIEDVRPTSLFTNFSMTLLIVFFLQSIRLLPSVKELIRLAAYKCPEASSRAKHTNDEWSSDFRIVHDISGWEHHLNAHYNCKSPSLSELLLQFFEFYSTKCDLLDDNSICLIQAQFVPKKSDEYCIELINPIEPSLNVTSNVRGVALSAFKQACQVSAMKIARHQNTAPNQSKAQQSALLLELIFKKVSAKRIKLMDLDWNEEVRSRKTRQKHTPKERHKSP